MMGLLSNIRGKKDGTPALGTVDVSPLAGKTKKTIIQEYAKLMEKQPRLFKIVWLRSSTRSNSIKHAFNIADGEDPQENETFVKLSDTIQAFFYKLIVTFELDEDLVRQACHQLGARHVDFIQRGFHSNFWDIFMVCMAEVIDETLTSYFNDEPRRVEVNLSYQRLINSVVHYMREGYNDRRRGQLQTKAAP